MEEITVEEAATRIASGESPVVLDVRETHEHAAGAMPGARHVSLKELPTRLNKIEQFLGGDKGAEIWVHCQGGGRSSQACAALLGAGFTNAKNVKGGYKAWKEKN